MKKLKIVPPFLISINSEEDAKKVADLLLRMRIKTIKDKSFTAKILIEDRVNYLFIGHLYSEDKTYVRKVAKVENFKDYFLYTAEEFVEKHKSKKNSIKQYIRDNMPESWSHVATEMRVREELIRRINDTIPNCYKNNKSYLDSINVLKRMFRATSLVYHLIDMTDADLEKWKTFSNKVKDYEESCR